MRTVGMVGRIRKRASGRAHNLKQMDYHDTASER